MESKSQQKIRFDLDQLQQDFEHCTGSTFKHFYCPILWSDEEVDLCLGHIINGALEDCPRTTILQRKDVDGFYGSLFENKFIAAQRADGLKAHEILGDKNLRREIPIAFEVDGKKVKHYKLNKHKAKNHCGVKLDVGNNHFLDVALAIDPEELESAQSVTVTAERDCSPDYTATMLKAAHLTLFRILGYKYVFGTAGAEVARILRTFYLENCDKPRSEQEQDGKSYFEQYMGMALPLSNFDRAQIKGSVEDNKFVICVGSSGHPYSLGVFLRTGDSLNIVFVPPENAEHMDTYCELTTDPFRKSFRYKIMEFIPKSDEQEAHWISSAEKVFQVA